MHLGEGQSLTLPGSLLGHLRQPQTHACRCRRILQGIRAAQTVSGCLGRLYNLCMTFSCSTCLVSCISQTVMQRQQLPAAARLMHADLQSMPATCASKCSSVFSTSRCIISESAHASMQRTRLNGCTCGFLGLHVAAGLAIHHAYDGAGSGTASGLHACRQTAGGERQGVVKGCRCSASAHTYSKPVMGTPGWEMKNVRCAVHALRCSKSMWRI